MTTGNDKVRAIRLKHHFAARYLLQYFKKRRNTHVFFILLFHHATLALCHFCLFYSSICRSPAPLCPSHVEALKQHDTSLEVSVLVQPSAHRIFSDAECEHPIAIVQDDLQAADAIFGAKHVEVDHLLEAKTYTCFVHDIKGQTENTPLLQEMLHTHIRLVDYECITANATADLNDPKSHPRRLLTFGRFSGIAGMLDMCQGLGQQLLAKGYLTHKLHCIGARHAHQGCQAESSV
jgi:hypothetical protein